MSNDLPTKQDFVYFFKWGAFIIILAALAIAALNVLGVLGSAASAPGRVINQTLGTNNIITSYEWFYDTNAQYQARSGQIKSHTKISQAEADPKERSRLNIEAAAMRQSCRDLASKYNANSEKANKMIFKSNGLPETLSINSCEQ